MADVNLQVVAFIFARGGSKTVPGKNLRVAGGKTLLNRSIAVARQVAGTDRVFVSTDSEEIALEAQAHGAQVIYRDAALATDDSPEWLSWQHAITEVKRRGIDFEIFISIPTTAPLRAVSDVQACIHALDDYVDCVVTMTPATHSPAFNMVTSDHSNLIRLGSEETGFASRRQDTPEMFNLTTVAYAARPEFILNNSSLWEGRVRGVTVPQERALDIDTEWDLHVADLVLADRDKNG